MPPPSKKQKWRRTDLSATERHVEDLALHERVDRLEAAGELFTLDTEGTSAASNLTQRARRLVKSRSLSATGEHGVRDSACLASSKAPLLQVVSKHHRKHILKVLQRKADAEKLQGAKTSSHASERKSAPTPHSSSLSAADIWGASIVASENAKKKKHLPSWLSSSPSSSSFSSSSSQTRPSSLALAPVRTAVNSKTELAEKSENSSRKREREEPDNETSSSSDILPKSKKQKASSSSSPSASSTSRSRDKVPARKKKRPALTSRALRSFDSLRAVVPAVQTPDHGESYNPSPEAHAQALLTAAVCTLEEREQWQQTGAHSRSQHVLPRDPEVLEELLLAKTLQEEDTKGSFSKYRKPVDAALAKVLPREKIQELSESQKQRLLYRLVDGGEKVLLDADGALRLVEEEVQHSAGDSEEENSEEEADDPSLFRQPVRREKKKTQADKNRHLRFLQQQRRRAAKLSSRERRAALARLDDLLRECDEDEEDRQEAQKDKEERLKAKIEAAKQGRVKLRIGRNRFVEPPPAVALPDDLSGGSLRTMKALRGGALSAQLTSLQRRGLVELPPTGGATAAYLRRVQKDRSRRISSKKPVRKRQLGT
ncbi:Nop53 (60S ribosomal biogenesis) protein [Toxoplasma gondii GAB2-2007-GAL-DOM2]|uniref:Ribosome biogenesis protein NOP53 n=2 Tax=Toxoplasma gondii TaxID=5811 RepID=B9QNX5_TOXGV|nr:Nop53 (60S ribosomal biogenesis) protein [Toxoplasma gondii VEG]KFG30891.1 Nop53 (60S ribosomal biogenesis) protein [Toxoplasma gondii GAB2-2007-GAL-DOM2]CEL74108.1 TPA: hypothetical protein BN1205_049460 [Toxoplasma gondii VEG]